MYGKLLQVVTSAADCDWLRITAAYPLCRQLLRHRIRDNRELHFNCNIRVVNAV
jgi:hypothetical protein